MSHEWEREWMRDMCEFQLEKALQRVEELEGGLRTIVQIGENREAEGHPVGAAYLIAKELFEK